MSAGPATADGGVGGGAGGGAGGTGYIAPANNGAMGTNGGGGGGGSAGGGSGGEGATSDVAFPGGTGGAGGTDTSVADRDGQNGGNGLTSGPGSAGGGGGGGFNGNGSGASNLNNNGALIGGMGGSGGTGPTGQDLSGGGGGAGGYGAVVTGSNSTNINTGTVTGGNAGAGGAGGTAGSGSGGDGGLGILFDAATITFQNLTSGTVTGGSGGEGGAGGFGGPAGAGGAGGSAVKLLEGSITNNGLLSGGAGGAGGAASTGGTGGAGGAGGFGIQMTTGTVSNSGFISAGAGGAGGTTGSAGAGGSGGAGGIGVQFSASGAILNTNGTIAGGAGGAGAGGGAVSSAVGSGGAGGTGVSMLDGSVTNGGLIQGGSGGDSGQFGQPGSGGMGGAGIAMSSGPVINTGSIIGGGGGASNQNVVGASGGAGISMLDGVLTNHQTITGGAGGAGGGNESDSFSPGEGGVGGAGVSKSTGSISNDGTVTGGAGGAGGGGTSLQAGAVGGTGGAGVALSSGGTLTNSQTIQGGAGGTGGSSISRLGGAGGTGGAGVTMSDGTFTNNGSVIGGNGGGGGSGAPFQNSSGVGNSGVGGVGVSGANLTIVDSGTIAGGNGAAAVTFTGGTNVLELQAGYTITGNVVAFSNADTFRLGGATNSTFNVANVGPAAQYQGFGVFVKAGTSTWTLTGTTTAVTPWTISAGTLDVSADGALGATSGGLTFTGGTMEVTGAGFTSARGVALGTGGGTMQIDTGALTLSGVIAASGGTLGGLTKIGAGTLTLTGANTYSGGTTLTAGVLQVGVDTVYNTANTPSSGIKSSAIGTGTLTFDGGTLQGPDSGANSTTIANAVQINGTGGTIDSNHSNNFTLSGNITNGNAMIGSLTIEDTTGDSGVLLSGRNTYSGPTIIMSTSEIIAGSAGALSPNSAFSVAGFLNLAGFGNTIYSLSGTGFVGGGTLTIAPSSGTTSFSGVLENMHTALSIVKSGAGTQIISGTSNTYTGTTTVNGGTLEVDGSIATSSLTTVNSTGTLTGTGAVGATTIASGGIFMPGSGAPGSSMTVSSLSLAGGAFYMVQLNPTTSSFANVTSTATLGGATVDAFYANGSYVAKQYTILTAGSVSGSFGSLVNTNLPSNFRTTLSYDGKDAYLNLILTFVPPPGSGLNSNQQNVGSAIVGFFNSSGSIPLVFGGLTPAGLTQISGETATGSQQTTFDAMNQFMGVLTDPFIDGRGDGVNGGGSSATGYASTQKPAVRDANAMFTKAMPAAPTFDQRWSVWAAGFGGSQTTSGNATLGSNDATSRIYGTAVGADYRFSPFTIAGFALAGGGTSFNVANAGTGRSDLFQAGAFIRHNAGPAYITAALAYGWQDVTTNRTVTIAGIDMLQARFNANAWSGRLEGGYRYATPWMGVTPYAAAQFTTFELPAYAEGVLSGAGMFALAYAAKSVTDSRSELGIRTDKSWAMTDSIFTLRGRVAWAHDYDPDRSIAATFQTLPGASFVVNGAAQAHDSALTTASAEIKWMNGWSAAATFEGEFSSVTNSYAGKGVVRYAW
jgi:uncharacterized protein with beta-barrel porin domain